MLHEEKSRPFRGIGALQRWHAGLSALIGRQQHDELRRETEDLQHRLGRRLEKLSAWLCWLEPWWIEGFLTLTSAFAASVLITSPDLFANQPGSYGMVASLHAAPAAWGVLALAASLAIAAGLAMTFPRARTAAVLLRLAGVTLAGLFWFAMGVSAILGDPTNIYAMAPFLGSLWALWVLVRFPAIP